VIAITQKVPIPPAKGPLWQFYYAGKKQNSSQFKAYCLACINHHCTADLHDVRDGEAKMSTFEDMQWFKDGAKINCSTN
jgi:hypothetical protein